MFLLFVAAMAHILLSGTYKSNTFSRPFFVCTLRTQFACKTAKRAIYQQEISPDAGITPNDQSGKG
ncbi:hypothetical protein EAN86_11790 [Klebsiella pneumoniae]|nr:hypothetical protein EAN86_11790 [Klebsiella pneumoniae]